MSNIYLFCLRSSKWSYRAIHELYAMCIVVRARNVSDASTAFFSVLKKAFSNWLVALFSCEQEMAEICRLCASFKTTDLLVPLLDPTHSIPAKVEKCCRINISNEMDLPQNVCKGCLDTLNMSHAFAETVAMAQNTLRKAIASRSITASSVTQPFRSSQNFDRIIKWDQRKVSTSFANDKQS